MKTLTGKECKILLNTHLGLLFFVGRKLKLFPLRTSFDEFLDIDIQIIFQCRLAVVKSESLIDDYLKLKSDQLTQEQIKIIMGFKKQITGHFVILKCLTDHAIFIDVKSNKFYAVKALSDSFEDLFDKFPVIIKTTILPFYDKIIYDGFFESPIMYVGSNMKKTFTKDYKQATKQNDILLTIE